MYPNDRDALQVIELVAMTSLSESFSIYSRVPSMPESSERPTRIIPPMSVGMRRHVEFQTGSCCEVCFFVVSDINLTSLSILAYTWGIE